MAEETGIVTGRRERNAGWLPLGANQVNVVCGFGEQPTGRVQTTKRSTHTHAQPVPVGRRKRTGAGRGAFNRDWLIEQRKREDAKTRRRACQWGVCGEPLATELACPAVD